MDDRWRPLAGPNNSTRGLIRPVHAAAAAAAEGANAGREAQGGPPAVVASDPGAGASEREGPAGRSARILARMRAEGSLVPLTLQEEAAQAVAAGQGVGGALLKLAATVEGSLMYPTRGD